MRRSYVKIIPVVIYFLISLFYLHGQCGLFTILQTSPSYGSYEFFAHGATKAGPDGSSSDGAQTGSLPDDVLSDRRLPYLGSSRRSRSPFSDSDSSQYTTFSDISGSSTLFDTPCSRPRPIGSRGRGGDTAAVCRAKNRGVSMRMVKSNAQVCFKCFSL